MSGKIRNPERRCKICGNKCEKVMRYCKACARAIKEDRARACGRPLATQEGSAL
jgi:predicted amidophosphoribosyltransferase